MSPLDRFVLAFIGVMTLIYSGKQGYFDVFVAFGFIFIAILFYWIINPAEDEGGI